MNTRAVSVRKSGCSLTMFSKVYLLWFGFMKPKVKVVTAETTIMSEFKRRFRCMVRASLFKTFAFTPGSFVFLALSAEEVRTSLIFFEENDSLSSRKDDCMEDISRPRNLIRPAKNERTMTISVQRTAFVRKTLSIPSEIRTKTATMQIKTDKRIIFNFIQPPYR